MRRVLIACVLVLVFRLGRAERKVEEQKSKVTKLDVVDLGEAEIEPDLQQLDAQQKRASGYSYNKATRVPSNHRIRLQVNQPRSPIVSRIPAQLSRPFTRYGLPNHSTAAHGYHAQPHRNKLQHHVSQQQQPSIGSDVGLTQQEVPTPIRNVDFTEVNPIAGQNNEPFSMHTANYLPPQNQKLPAYSSTDNFALQFYPPPSSFLNQGSQVQGTDSQSQNLATQAPNHPISDAALFLSENAQAIQQLYGAPASNQDFAPANYDGQFQGTGNQIGNPNGRMRNSEIASQSPVEFRGALPAYASGTLNPHETLEQIQSLEKDRLIVQLQQALAQAQITGPATEAAGRYAQNQASFIQNQELLASISQQMRSHAPTTPQTIVAFGSGNNAFSQSPFLPGTTVNPLDFTLNYGVPTTARTPTTTTTTTTGVPASPAQPPQPSRGSGSIPATSSLPAPNHPAAGTPVGIPIYGGFVPTLIAGTNFVPSYSTSIFTSGPVVRPVLPSSSTPTHVGIPIPTESTLSSAPSIPAATPSSVLSTRPGGVALTPVIAPAAVPVQPLRPVATPLHPVATPIHPVVTPLHPVLPTNPVQVQPVPAAPAVTSGAHPTYGLQTTLINPVVYKPIKAVYPVYYYPNVAYPLQKPTLPSYPWGYAPSYAQTKPAQIWK